MIFVTVGTTHFDALVEEVDMLLERGVIKDRVVAQIGSGRYEPRHAEWFRFRDDLRDLEEAAELVICHGGVGSVFELAALGKPFIAVPNRRVDGDHQADLLRSLEAEEWCVCCWELSELAERVTNRSRITTYRPNVELPRIIWEEGLGGALHARRAAARVSRYSRHRAV